MGRAVSLSTHGIEANGGLNVVANVNALRACCDTSLNHAIGIADRVPVVTACVTSSLGTVGRSVHLIKGTPPRVLFLITWWWTTGVVLIFCFAVGLRDVIIAGVSVMQSRVMIGVSSITHCCSAFTLCSTLCYVPWSGIGGGGVKCCQCAFGEAWGDNGLWLLRPLLCPWRLTPLWVLVGVDGELTLATDNVAGITWLASRYGTLLSRVCNKDCTGNDQATGWGTNHQLPVMPMTPLYCHPHKWQPCNLMGQEGICSSRMVHSVTRTPKSPGSRGMLSSCLGYFEFGVSVNPTIGWGNRHPS